MNKGKICISVCAETAVGLVEQLNKAEALADVIEIRFDCLHENEISEVLNLPTLSRPQIHTFRPKEQGGNRGLSDNERFTFWDDHTAHFEKTVSLTSRKSLADLELDLIKTIGGMNPRNIIGSFHDFNGVPANLLEIYENLRETGCGVIKIAVQADDIADTISIWKLLERAQSENKEIIPIAMGECGKWTRILGLAHGAFLSYASVDPGRETAPGQVSANDLTEVYRAKELDDNTEVYGIIGGNTTYSMSPFMHNEAFKFHKLNSVFVPLQVQNLDKFMRRMVLKKTREIELNFKGFAVTIPHKQSIVRFLDQIDETAEIIGVVNTVKIDNGKLHGFNTDAHGFIEPLKNAYGDLRGARAAVFGSGGAARACIYALVKENAGVTLFSRDARKGEMLAHEFNIACRQMPVETSSDRFLEGFDIAVNATPLGTKGDLEDLTIAYADQLRDLKLVYDLVYNPFETRFLKEARAADVPAIGGLAMLVAQALKQQEIWTGKPAPMKEMSRAALNRLER